MIPFYVILFDRFAFGNYVLSSLFTSLETHIFVKSVLKLKGNWNTSMTLVSFWGQRTRALLLVVKEVGEGNGKS